MATTMEVFPSMVCDTLLHISHPGKYDAFESLMQQGRVRAFISFIEPDHSRIFHMEVVDWNARPVHVDNFKRAVRESKQVSFFKPKPIMWRQAAKKLKSPPITEKKNSDQRMSFQMDNLLLVKQLFSFGLLTVPDGEGHVYQTTEAPMLICSMSEKGMQMTPKPCTVRRSFVYQDEPAYDRYVLRPNSVYVVPPGTSYVILTVQKTLFSVTVMAWENVMDLQDYRCHRQYVPNEYKLPPPTPAHEMQAPKRMRMEANDDAWLDNIGSQVAPETIQDFLVGFFKELEPPTQEDPVAMQTDFPVVNNHLLSSEMDDIFLPPTKVIVSPPPDNYWGPTQEREEELFTTWDETPETNPLDLRVYKNVKYCNPIKTNCVQPVLPLDLRMNKI